MQNWFCDKYKQLLFCRNGVCMYVIICVYMVIGYINLFNRILTWRYWLEQVRRVIMLLLYTFFFQYNPIIDLVSQVRESKGQPQTHLNFKLLNSRRYSNCSK